MLKLRRYDPEVDGQLEAGKENLYVWRNNNYWKVDILATDLKGPMNIVYAIKELGESDTMGNEPRIGGGDIMVEDPSLEFKKDDVVVCGWHEPTGGKGNGERWYEWMGVVSGLNSNDCLSLSIDWVLGSSDDDDDINGLKMNVICTSQDWIRHADDEEVRSLVERIKTSDNNTLIKMYDGWRGRVEEIGLPGELKPFDRVLVRDTDTDIWQPAIFVWKENGSSYRVIASEDRLYWRCVPYEGNEDICGTNKSPNIL